jgi:hypothetical protein
MSQDLKKIRTPLILASTVTLIAFVYFGYQQYKISSRMDQFASLVSADQAFFNHEFDKAFEIYNELDSDFFGDSLLQLRRDFKSHFIDHGKASKFLDDEVKEELVSFIANCKSNETIQSLNEISEIELIKMLKDCYSSTKSQKVKYQNKVSNQENLSYLRINGDKNIHYFGELEEGKASGHGVGVWENQSFYEGQWKNNMRHGLGKFTTEKGEIYEGEYQNNKRNGKGTYVFRNGDYYTGEWKDSGRSGFGTVISAKGDTLVHGFWENDRFDRRRTRNELGK